MSHPLLAGTLFPSLAGNFLGPPRADAVNGRVATCAAVDGGEHGGIAALPASLMRHATGRMLRDGQASRWCAGPWTLKKRKRNAAFL